MFILRARKGSFLFKLTANGWQVDHRVGGAPASRFDAESVSQIAANEEDKNDFDVVWYEFA